MLSWVSSTPFEPREPMSNPTTGSAGAWGQGAEPATLLIFMRSVFRFSMFFVSMRRASPPRGGPKLPQVNTSTTTRLASFTGSVVGLMMAARLRSLAILTTSRRSAAPTGVWLWVWLRSMAASCSTGTFGV